jgi:NhaC family Na+:H+ antiporter
MRKTLSETKSFILLLASVFVVFIGVVVIKANSTIVLTTAGVVAITLSIIWGIKWDDIQSDLLENLGAMLQSILILLSVGMLVGAWILSGTVPVMVYYGLKVLRPSTFLFAAALICAIMSVMTGTSWGTIGTVGVALMGVSTGLGVPLQYTAGAVVVGAIFGDKLSPLSDTTVMASAVSNVDIVDHIKYMLYTTLPGFIISLILYLIIGFRYSGGTVTGDNLHLILNTLEETFNLNPILLLPPIVVLLLIFMRKPTLPVFAIGITLGCVLAFIFQGSNILEIANALNGGYTNTTGVEIVDTMLIRGGLQSMLGTVALLIGAGVFGSPLRTAGVIQVLIDKITSKVKNQKGILASIYLLHGGLFAITGSYYVTFAVLAPMVRTLYDRFGLHRKNLSRTLEDSGTAFAPIVPWSVTGAFIATTLGVETVEYILYAPMTYLGIIFGLLYSISGFKIAKSDASVTNVKLKGVNA